MSRAVLGFDTATPDTVVALLAPDGGCGEERHQPPAGERPGHAAQLLPLAERVLAGGGGWEAVHLLAVGTGPGSFTGLRIGIATARALAQGRGLPLAGVSTLRALAAAGADEEPDSTVLAVLDARRGEAFAAAWQGDELVLEPAALAPEVLAEQAAGLGESVLAVGDGAVRFRDRLAPSGLTVPAEDSALHHVSGRHLCRLATRAAQRPPEAVVPDYLRLPDAEIARRSRP